MSNPFKVGDYVRRRPGTIVPGDFWAARYGDAICKVASVVVDRIGVERLDQHYTYSGGWCSQYFDLVSPTDVQNDRVNRLKAKADQARAELAAAVKTLEDLVLPVVEVDAKYGPKNAGTAQPITVRYVIDDKAWVRFRSGAEGVMPVETIRRNYVRCDTTPEAPVSST